jgi:multiple sugar transport system permease protein
MSGTRTIGWFRTRTGDDHSRQVLLMLQGMLIIAAIVTLLPYAWMLSASLRPNMEIFSASLNLIPPHPNLDNYRSALSGTPVLSAIWNSIIMASGETVAVVATSIFTAYPFARLRFRGRDTVFLMVLGAMMIPSQVTMIPTFILMKWLGWINTYQGLIVPRAVTPIGIFMMRQFLLTLPRELEEAALIDGCGRLRILWQICVPHLGPAAATLAIFTFTTSWNEFFWPLIVIQSEEMQTIQLLIAALKQAEAPDWGVMMAIITLSVVPTVAIYLMLQRYFVKGVALSGMKG